MKLSQLLAHIFAFVCACKSSEAATAALKKSPRDFLLTSLPYGAASGGGTSVHWTKVGEGGAYKASMKANMGCTGSTYCGNPANAGLARFCGKLQGVPQNDAGGTG